MSVEQEAKPSVTDRAESENGVGNIFTLQFVKLLKHGQTASSAVRRWAGNAATGARATNATLEECIYYADQQYVNNNDSPLQVLDKEAPINFPSDEQNAAPGPEIRHGPLRFIWGPESPKVDDHQVGVGTSVVSNTAEKRTRTIDASKLDESKDADKDILDRLLLRRVSLLRAFFLVTTDTIGPFQAPFVYSQVGFVPATVVFFIMGVLACFAGLCLNVLWLRLDSDVMPIRNIGYLTKRIWGPRGKFMVDIMFIVQLIIQCGVLLLSCGQSMGMIIDGAQRRLDGSPVHHVCFTVLVVCMCGLQLLLSPVRSLKSLSWLTFGAIGTGIAAVSITTAFVYNTPPNYEQALRSLGVPPGPIQTSAIVDQKMTNKITGIMNLIYAFGGSMIFPDIFSEMRKPWQFWKSAVCAQILIITVYITIGTLVYARQGQFTLPVYYFGLSKYAYQTVGNAMGIVLGIVAAMLYGNVVQKHLYYVVVRSWFKGPGLMSRKGLPFWLLGNCVIWGTAFTVGSAIPQIQTISGLISAVTIMQFSFSFPFLLKLSFDVQVDAMRYDKPFVVRAAPVGALSSSTVEVDGTLARNSIVLGENRIDSWRDWSRWKRGLFSGNVPVKAVFFTLTLASLSLAILGVYGTVNSVIDTFKVAAATSFGCETP